MIQATPQRRAQLAEAARARRTSMWDTLHAEWTKARTLRSTGWLLLAAVLLTVVVSAAVAATVRCPSGHCAEDPAKISLTGIYLGQALIAIAAVLAVSGEYSTGMIRTSLAAMPAGPPCWPPRQPSSPVRSWPPGSWPCSAQCWPGG